MTHLYVWRADEGDAPGGLFRIVVSFLRKLMKEKDRIERVRAEVAAKAERARQRAEAVCMYMYMYMYMYMCMYMYVYMWEI